MFKKLFFIGLLAISLVAFIASEAPALLKSCVGGSCTNCDCIVGNLIPQCTLCGKCLEGTTTATGLGNVDNTPTFVKMQVCVGGRFTFGTTGNEDPYVECTAIPGEPADWGVVCGAPGNEWPAPGVNLGYAPGELISIQPILC